MRKKRRKPEAKPFCTGAHRWGIFIPYGTSGLRKKCEFCPATLSKEEFLKNKMIPDFIIAPKLEVKHQHVDLFVF
jgi:hypothetical protein